MPQPSYSLPQCAPLYAAPPFDYRAYSRVSVFASVDAQALRRALPSVFELRDNVVEFFIMDVPNGGSLGQYAEGGVVVPITFQGRPGGHVLYEIVTNDDAMAAGREIWGYPKKMGEVAWSASDTTIKASLSRRGVSLIDIDFAAAEDARFEKPDLHPRFQTRIIPSPTSAAVQTQIIENALGQSRVLRQCFGTAQLVLGGTHADPFSDLAVEKILGAEALTADFVLGFGKIVA